MFHSTFGEYYVSGFVHGSSYWLQCEVDISEVLSDSSLSLTASVDGGKLGSGSGGGHIGAASNSSKKVTHFTRHLKGHDFQKMSGGPIDITTGAQDMLNF